jgi:MraZ protein
MSGAFYSTYIHAVHKGRVVIPAKWVEKIAPEANNTVICTTGFDKCIVVYPYDYWEKYAADIETGTSEEEKFKLHQKFDNLDEQQLEGPGRIKIASKFLEHANITDKVCFVGHRSHFLMWNPEDFEIYKQKVNNN